MKINKFLILVFVLFATSSLSMGSKNSCPPAENFVNSFDSAVVIKNADEAWKLGRVILFRLEADRQLGGSSFSRYQLWEALSKIHPQLFWIKDSILKNPEDTRCKSYFSYGVIDSNIEWVRNSYQDAGLFYDVEEKTELFIQKLEEIIKFYKTR